jgi:HPt (histidine-containing phosphotransfer) domain-containing protein
MNLKNLARNLGLEDDEFLEIMELYIETSDSDFDKIQSAINAGDAQTILEAAHSIKGASGNFGFKKAYEAAGKIELEARNGQIATIAETAKTLQNELLQIKSIISHQGN